MGAKTVGSLSMKICGKGGRGWMGQRARPSGCPVPPPSPAAPFQVYALLTAPVSSFSVEMRPLRRLHGEDTEEVSRATVCVSGGRWGG